MKTTPYEKLNGTQQKVADYIFQGVEKGKHFFKSKYIAKDLGLTPKEVGTAISGFLEHDGEKSLPSAIEKTSRKLIVKRHTYSNSTTWFAECGSSLAEPALS